MTLTRRILMLAAVIGAAGLATPSVAQSAPDGPILLTVTGSVSNPTRGEYDPDKDKFFGFNEVEFANAAQFDFEALNQTSGHQDQDPGRLA